MHTPNPYRSILTIGQMITLFNISYSILYYILYSITPYSILHTPYSSDIVHTTLLLLFLLDSLHYTIPFPYSIFHTPYSIDIVHSPQSIVHSPYSALPQLHMPTGHNDPQAVFTFRISEFFYETSFDPLPCYIFHTTFHTILHIPWSLQFTMFH